MKTKKGISGLIETALLILVVLAAAGILVGVVLPMIRGPIEKAQICQGAMDISANNASVTVTLSKEVAITTVAINVYNATDVKATTKDLAAMKVGEAQTLALPAGITNAIKVTVVPKITINGKTETCPAIETAV